VAGGEFTTKPLRFEGSELELNFATSAAGSVRVEIQDEHGSRFQATAWKTARRSSATSSSAW
jgi:hypothetical protein